MPKIPYVAPKIDTPPYLVCGCRLVKRVDTRQIVPVWLARPLPTHLKSCYLSAWPVRPVTDEMVKLLATHRPNC